MRFVAYPDTDGEWRWRLKANNQEIIAVSSEGYKRKRDCLAAIDLVKEASNATVVVLEPKDLGR